MVEYRIRADLAAAFDAACRPGHIRSDLIHGVLTGAVRAWHSGAQLPRPPRRVQSGVGTANWRFTCPEDERDELSDALKAAGSSGRAVLEAFARAYVEAGGSLLKMRLPWEQQACAELPKAS